MLLWARGYCRRKLEGQRGPRLGLDVTATTGTFGIVYTVLTSKLGMMSMLRWPPMSLPRWCLYVDGCYVGRKVVTVK